jgi:asparagine synthase (glutamine-hydrolysing)
MATADGKTVIVYNGEVYNFPELRRELESKGHVFRTKSDTEVVLEVYERHGESAPEKLNGQFALAVWDARTEELYLARDRLGLKPLFYHAGRDRFVFASSLEALLEAGDVPREIDPVSLELYLTFGYVPATRTIFRHVSKLPPGCRLTVRGGRISERRYWRVPPGPFVGPVDKLALQEELRRHLAEAVRVRLVSDVPLGAFLSGGIDSSIVVALMSELADGPVRTFAIGFEDALYNELTYAAEVARRCRSEHREFIVEPRCAEVLEELVPLFGEPFADSSAIPTWYLSGKTRQHVKVALSGDGGDELFGGYDRYRAMRLAKLCDASPRFLRRMLSGVARLGRSAERRSHGHRIRRFLAALSDDPVERYLKWVSVFDAASREQVTTSDFRDSLDGFRGEEYLRWHFSKQAETSPPERAMAADLDSYLPGDLLVKTDVASMAWGLEVRCPFLDHRLVAFARQIPTRLKLSLFTGKRILRRAFADKLPESVARRKKMGFGVPLGRWFRGELRPMLSDVLLGGKAFSRGVLRPEGVRGLIDEHVQGLADHSAKLYALLFLELWYRKFVG